MQGSTETKSKAALDKVNHRYNHPTKILILKVPYDVYPGVKFSLRIDNYGSKYKTIKTENEYLILAQLG